MPARAGVGQVDRDLGVLDPSGGAGVLALHPDRGHALLEVAGLVDHQHRVAVCEGGGDVVAQVITHSIGVPRGSPEQVLHAVRVQVAGVFGDAPAVLPRQVSEQPQEEPAGAAAGRHPGESPSHPVEEPVGLGLPAVGFYAVAHGHRMIFGCRHNG